MAAEWTSPPGHTPAPRCPPGLLSTLQHSFLSPRQTWLCVPPPLLWADFALLPAVTNGKQISLLIRDHHFFFTSGVMRKTSADVFWRATVTNDVSALHFYSLLTFASISLSFLPNRVGSALCQPRGMKLKRDAWWMEFMWELCLEVFLNAMRGHLPPWMEQVILMQVSESIRAEKRLSREEVRGRRSSLRPEAVSVWVFCESWLKVWSRSWIISSYRDLNFL